MHTHTHVHMRERERERGRDVSAEGVIDIECLEQSLLPSFLPEKKIQENALHISTPEKSSDPHILENANLFLINLLECITNLEMSKQNFIFRHFYLLLCLINL